MIEKAKSAIRIDPEHPLYWPMVLTSVQELCKPRKRRKAPSGVRLTDEHKNRYRTAKYKYELAEFPQWVGDGHFLEPDYPDTGTANGLTAFITQYLTWIGCRATRVSSAGRQLPNGKYIPSTTRNGSADISSTISGKSVMWEIKIGKDKPSPAQIKEQARERKAGGEYFFTTSVDQFFEQLDSLSEQKSLF